MKKFMKKAVALAITAAMAVGMVLSTGAGIASVKAAETTLTYMYLDGNVYALDSSAEAVGTLGTNLGSVAWNLDNGGVSIPASGLSDYSDYVGEAVLKVEFSTTGGQFYCADQSDWSKSATWYNNGGSEYFVLTSDMVNNGIMCNGADVTIDKITLLAVEKYVAYSDTITLTDKTVDWNDDTITSASVVADKFSEYKDLNGLVLLVDYTKTGQWGGQFYISDKGNANGTATWYSTNGKVTFAMTSAFLNNGVSFYGEDIEINSVSVWGKKPISLNEDSAELVAGDTYTIDYDSDASAPVSYESSNEEVATVSEGIVTAVNEGTAEITVKDSTGNTDTLEVTVSLPEFEISSDSIALKPGKTYDVASTVTGIGTPYTYSSSDENVATVSDAGIVTAQAEGTCTITVKDKYLSEVSLSVTVSNKEIVNMKNSVIELKIGDTYTAEDNIASGDYKAETWESSDETVASIKDGIITALGEGTTTISVMSSDDVESTFDVEVSKRVVSFEEDSATIDLSDGSYKIEIVGVDKPVASSWKSSDTSVATVDEDGVVTFVGAGEVKISCESEDGVVTEFTLTVVDDSDDDEDADDVDDEDADDVDDEDADDVDDEDADDVDDEDVDADDEDVDADDVVADDTDAEDTETGDASLIWIGVLAFAAAGVAVSVGLKKREEM